jgi:hypothetical protein
MQAILYLLRHPLRSWGRRLMEGVVTSCKTESTPRSASGVAIQRLLKGPARRRLEVNRPAQCVGRWPSVPRWPGLPAPSLARSLSLSNAAARDSRQSNLRFMNESIAQCRHLVSLADAMLAGLDDSHLALEPEPGAKTAGWLLGHLAITGDFARHLCGRPPICPAEWRSAFRDGSEPSRDQSSYPRMTELCAAFWGVYRDLPVAVANADAARLAEPNPYPPARGSFPLASNFVAYIISGHFGYHLGQLVAWRAAAGLGRLQRAPMSANTPETRKRSVT